MTTTQKYLFGTQTTLLSTELNSLANNSLAVGSAFDNTQGQAGDGYVLCDLELVVTYGSAPGVSTACTLWCLGTQDGTNYEDGDASTTPARLPECTFPLRAVTSAQRIIRRVWLPWGKWKPLLKNDGTGQAMASTANQLKVLPYTPQGV
jgi:hypothetical protein